MQHQWCCMMSLMVRCITQLIICWQILRLWALIAAATMRFRTCFPTADPSPRLCLVGTMRNMLSTQSANERDNPIIGLIFETMRQVIIFNSANNDNAAMCCKLFSLKINASGWKTHLRLHDIMDNDTASSTPFRKYMVKATPSYIRKFVFLTFILEGFKNDVINYVMQGDVMLQAAGSDLFKQFVVALTHGYESSSTRWIASCTRSSACNIHLQSDGRHLVDSRRLIQ